MSQPPVRTAFQIPHATTVLHGSTLGREPGEAPRILALHGGGEATSHRRSDYLLEPLAQAGWPSAGFDHVGHGETGGSLIGSSLNERLQQARSVATGLSLQRPDALIAASMGGHIACRLLDELQPRLLVLYCPAAYIPEVEDTPFGPQFQSALRASKDFASSPAFAALRRFRGRVMLVWGEHEQVIPPSVQQLYADSARHAAQCDIVRLPGADHSLHLWLQQRPEQARMVRERIQSLLNTDPVTLTQRSGLSPA